MEKCMAKKKSKDRNKECRDECILEMQRQPKYHEMLIAQAAKTLAKAQQRINRIKKAADQKERTTLKMINDAYNTGIAKKAQEEAAAQGHLDSLTQKVLDLTEELEKTKAEQTKAQATVDDL